MYETLEVFLEALFPSQLFFLVLQNQHKCVLFCPEGCLVHHRISSEQMLEVEKSVSEDKKCQQCKLSTTTATSTTRAKGLIRQDVTTSLQFLPSTHLVFIFLLLPLQQQQQHRMREIKDVVSLQFFQKYVSVCEIRI